MVDGRFAWHTINDNIPLADLVTRMKIEFREEIKQQSKPLEKY